MGYAVLHLEKAKGTDSRMSAHIERTVHPKNADRTRTHLNRELVQFPEGVRNMLRLVENGIVTESEISELLEDKYNIKKDYEWYSEDFMGCELDESTDIRIEDVWELCAERVEKVVGAKI